MQNLTQYSDQELSLHVFNDEYLYSIRKDLDTLMDKIEEFFIYTQEQMNELVLDLLNEEGV